MIEGVRKEIVREWVLGLEAFKGRGYEDYAYLIGPFTEFVFKSGFDKIKVEEFNKLAQALVASETKVTPTKIEEPTITAKFLAGQIRPWVEDIRETLFHKKAAPFKCNDDAEKWLDEAKKGIEEWLEKLEERVKRHEEYHAYLDALYEKYSLFVSKWDAWLNPPIEHPTQEEMQYFTEAEQRRIMSLKPGEPIEESEQVKAYIGLRDNAQKISEVTGFAVESVRMYILADVFPVLPPVTFGIVKETHPLPSGKSLLNRYAKVTIRGGLTEKDLRSLYRMINGENTELIPPYKAFKLPTKEFKLDLNA